MAAKILTWNDVTGQYETSSVEVANVVTGPASVTDNVIARFDLTTGKVIQGSSLRVDDSGFILNASGERVIVFDGLNNTFLGRISGSLTASGSANVGVGVASLGSVTSGSYNVAIGFTALRALTTTHNNVAIGYESLRFGSPGNNVAAGFRTGLNQSGSSNIFLGHNVGAGVAGSGTNNIFIGTFSAGAVTTGSYNTSIGVLTCVDLNTGSNNTSVGYEGIRYFTTASANTALGYRSLRGVTLVSTGGSNTALGISALQNVTTGTNNTAAGQSAGLNVAGGGSNVCIGSGSGSTLTSGTNNTLAGSSTNVSTNSLTNTIGLGNGVTVDASNKVKIGDSAVTLIEVPTNSNIQTPSGEVGINRGLRVNGSTSGTLTFQPAATTSSHSITMPSAQGDANTFPRNNSSGNLSWVRAQWVVSQKTTNYTAVHLDKILADTSGGSFTVTLPATPAVGDAVMIMDGANSFGTNSLTVGRNGENIQGIASDYTINTNNAWLEFVYCGATFGWTVRP